MTTNVITVTPDTSIQALAALLSERGISGVPVVDAAGRLVGIVSEGDLLHRAETGTARRTERRRFRWLDTVASDQELARDYMKSRGRVVSDVMSREVIAVTEMAELAEIADLLEIKRIKRVPVVRDGKLVGIVSRANLVRALATVKAESSSSSDTGDHAIRQKLLAELQAQEWAGPWAADIVVRDGVVHLWLPEGHSEEEKRAVHVAAENIAGVRAVEEHIVQIPLIQALMTRL
jgi:CBS domain-containing protein